MCRITPESLAVAVHELNGMSLDAQQHLLDEIYRAQPNMLASVIVLSQFDVHASRIEFAVRMLLLCFLAMKTSGHRWPLITEDHQDACLRQLIELMVQEEALDANGRPRIDAKRYLLHPERYLFTYVLSQTRDWLNDLPALESDKYLMLAVFNLVESIAQPGTGRSKHR